MKLKILKSCSGLNFSYSKDEEYEVADKIAKELIKAKYAQEVKANGQTGK